MNDTLLNKPAFTLSVGELMAAIKGEILANMPTQPQTITKESQKQFAYSIKEAADFFHVSPVTLQMWKNTGFVKFTQHGRKLIIDLPGTMELLNKKTRK